MPKIIGFGHRRRVGKDTACKFLDSILRLEGKRVRKVSFAASLKDTAYQLWGWAGLKPGIFYETPAGAAEREVVLPKIGKSPRTLWIELGNKVREIYIATWIDKALLDVAPNVEYVLISDVRYANEVSRIQELGGMVHKITRSDVEISNDIADSALDSFEGWDSIIQNDGDMMALYLAMERLVGV